MRGSEQASVVSVRDAGAGTSMLAGLLAGAAVGLLAAIVSVPLRRLAGVSDRAIVNGASVVIGAVVLWTLIGGMHAALRRYSGLARRAVTGAAIAAAVVGTLAVYTALGGFARRLPSLAVPLVLLVTLVGAVLFFALLRQRLSLPLRLVAPGGLVVAVVAGVLVSALDRTPAVHYTLSKLPVSARLAATVTAAPAGDAPAPTTTAGPLRFTVASGSEAAYTAHEKLTRLPSPSDAVGKTQTMTGDVYLDRSTGLATSAPSIISVDLRTLTTDSPMRDGFIKMSTLQTDQYPMATFTITSIDGFPSTYTEGDEAKVTVNGTMKMHGIEKPVAWTGTARYAGTQLEAVLSADVTLTEFGVTPPQVPVVQSVDDKVHLDLHLVLVQAT